MAELRLAWTKHGSPAMWERGGGYSNTGDAQVIADREGKPKRPVFVRRRGHRACLEHALVVVCPGDYVVQAERRRREHYVVRIYRLVRLGAVSVLAELVAESEDGLGEVPEFLAGAVEAAREKAACYHCREPHYVAKEG